MAANRTQRWMTVIRANSNDRIDRAEDPARLLDHLVFEMRAQLVDAKRATCVAIADERVLSRRAEQHESEAAMWEQRAMLAVRGGHDELARAALVRKAEQEEIARSYRGQWLEQKRAVDELRHALALLEGRIAEAARQRVILGARLARAQAQRSIAAAMAGLASRSPSSALERLEERVARFEAEAEACSEICELSVASRDGLLEQQFRELAAGNVDDELAALKRRMALEGTTRRALPA